MLTLGPHRPSEAASQSLFLAPKTKKVPRACPVESNAKMRESCPESFRPKMIPGCVTLVTATEFSTRSCCVDVSTVTTDMSPESSSDGVDWLQLAGTSPPKASVTMKFYIRARIMFPCRLIA